MGGGCAERPPWGEVASYEERQKDVGGEVWSRDTASRFVSSVIAAAPPGGQGQEVLGKPGHGVVKGTPKAPKAWDPGHASM